MGEGRPTPAAMLAGQQGVSLLSKHLPFRARSLGRSTAASVAARSPHGAWPGALPGAAVPEPQPPARGGLFEEEPGSHRSRFFFFGKFLRNSKQSDDEFNQSCVSIWSLRSCVQFKCPLSQDQSRCLSRKKTSDPGWRQVASEHRNWDKWLSRSARPPSVAAVTLGAREPRPSPLGLTACLPSGTVSW